MKTKVATGKYAVSFNTRFGGNGDYEVGESGEDSIDYAGDNIDALAAETIAGDPSFPLKFERVTHSTVIGVFREVEDETSIVALLVPYSSIS